MQRHESDTSLDWNRVPSFGVRSEGVVYTVRPSAYALIQNDRGEVAIVRSADGVFLPGGGIDSGETLEQAVRREGVEECGLLLHPGACLSRAVQFLYSKAEGVHFEKRSAFLEAAIVGKAENGMVPGHELAWLDPEAAVRELSHPCDAWVVEQWDVRACDLSGGKPMDRVRDSVNPERGDPS